MSEKRRLRFPVRLVVSGIVLVAVLAAGLALSSRALAQGPMPDPQPVKVYFTTGGCTVTEGDSVTLTVCLSQASSQVVTVQFTATINIEGMQDQCTGTIQFDPGETSKTETYTTTDDACCQGTGSVQIVLSNPLGAQLGSASTITVTVLDNDTCP